MRNGKDNDRTDLRNKTTDGFTDFKGWGYRHSQCLILFCCLTTAYSMRACMGVALVAMVDSDLNTQHALNINNSLTENNINGTLYAVNGINIENTNQTESNQKNSGGFLHSLLLVPPYPKLNWNKKTQDTVLSSFFFGYMLLQIPAGQLAHFFGARYLLSGALFVNCLMSFCLPWATIYGGWILTAIFRTVQGLSQACVVPGMHTMFGKWTTLEERGRLAGLAYGGQALGAVLGLPITGFIAASPLGWPGIFRFYGILSGIVGGAILVLSANSPAEHPKISAAERQYIEGGIGNNENSKKKLRVPWGSILRCRGLYAIILAHIGNTWGQLTLYSEVPAYMDKVMGVNIKANGVLTALPFLAMWFTNFFFSWFTDMLIVKKILSVRSTRKLANSMGSIPACIGLIALAYAPRNIYVVEALLIFICSFKIATNVGFTINHIDISSNFSGVMMSLSNFMSNVFALFAPIVAGYILTDVTDVKLWRKVFFVSAGWYFFTNLAYVIFGIAERADWDNPPEETYDVEDAKEMEPMIKDENTSNGEKKS
ncbi:putative inorganic phosphate cotransporter [Melitaea cinxia]|uniref:putative inorganic phosphate cotransporter n=1 Tax=Melitaea cinxia TaxID=113334 RepID=UPI001E26EEDB|nr:putative inorganic phosphate cotransporter [Melitaea cinxia]